MAQASMQCASINERIRSFLHLTRFYLPRKNNKNDKCVRGEREWGKNSDGIIEM